MTKRITLVLFSVLFLFTASAKAQDLTKEQLTLPKADNDPSSRTQIMILATPHLRSYGTDFRRSTLDRLLLLLERFKPELVGIEALAPRTIHEMLAHKNRFTPVLEQFAKATVEHGQAAQAAIGLDWPAAFDRADELLIDLQKQPDGQEKMQLRKELVVTLLASYDLYSALLQWYYLPPDEQGRVPNLDDAARTHFQELLTSSNETITIGLALAARLGLQSLHPIDDHADKDDFLEIAEQLQAGMMENELFRSQPWKPFLEKVNTRQQEAYQSGDLLPFYLFMNSPEYWLNDIEAQWQPFFRMELASGLDRTRAALWDVRNLNIASHIRRASASKPGARMVVIIGAAHKPFLDAYLNAMMDVEVKQLSELQAQ